MVFNKSILVLSLVTISAVCIHSQSPDISSFLSQMMREYVPKNTRQYTMVNGVPVDGNDGDSDSILSRISENPTFGPLVKTVLGNSDDPGSFLNSGPWNPVSAPASNPSSSFFSIFGRSGIPSEAENQESKIITVDDLQQRSDEPQEFKIESSMSFHR